MTMNITFEELPKGGRMVATVDGAEIGHVRWRVRSTGVWLYDSLFVAEAHRGQGVAAALMVAAKERRTEAQADWANVPTTKAGTSSVAGHIARNYESDPRVELD